MDKKPLTEKQFLRRANAKVSAEAFLQAHREYLTTGKLAEYTSPILARVDAKEIHPTPGLEAIKSVVFNHMIAGEVAKNEAAMKKAGTPKAEKQYQASIYDANGGLCSVKDEQGNDKELTFGSDDSGEVERWVDRKLFDGAPDWFGIITNTKMTTPDGEFYTQTILRDDSIARILRQPKAAASRKVGKTSAKLSWGMKCKGDYFRFSHG